MFQSLWTPLSWLLLTLTCLLSSGCGMTLGPQVKTQYVIVGVGRPVMVLQTLHVKARVLDAPEDSAPVDQSIGGWVAMPQEHFAVLKKAASRP